MSTSKKESNITNVNAKDYTTNCDYKIGNYQIWVEESLGSGYSGTVHRVTDQSGRAFALKLSKEKVISTQKNDNLFEEYQKLLVLSRSYTPVPQPKAFFGYADEHNWGQTGILMELVHGVSLREWVNQRPGGYHDPSSGRTVHPITNTNCAYLRLDCAIAVIESLSNLQRVGMFVDMKPRNLMITDSRRPRCCLVDAGGMVMAADLGTDDLTLTYVQPMKHRSLMETTSSYLSPELACTVCEFDRGRGRLFSHFKTTTHENFYDTEEIYSSIRRNLTEANILNENEEVFMGEASSVFIFGLVMTEMFGGQRTGLTALTRVPAVRQQYESQQKCTDVEFRCVLQWNEYIPELGCSYKDIFKEKCYPRSGWFSKAGGGSIGLAVESLLDSCFMMDPFMRPRFEEVVLNLNKIKELVSRVHTKTTQGDENYL